MVHKKGGAGFLDALVVTASRCCVEGGIGIGGLVLGLWAEICLLPWRGAYQLS